MCSSGVALLMLPAVAAAQMIVIRDAGALRGGGGQLVLRGDGVRGGAPWLGGAGLQMPRGFGAGEPAAVRAGVLLERTEKVWMPAGGGAVRRQEVEEEDRVSADGRRQVRRVTCTDGHCEGAMASGPSLASASSDQVRTGAVPVLLRRAPVMHEVDQAQAPAQLEDLAGHVMDYAAERARAMAFVESHSGVRWEVEGDDGREEDAAQLASEDAARTDPTDKPTAKAPKAPASAAADGVHRGVEAMVDMDRAEDDLQRDAIAGLAAKADAFNEGIAREAAQGVAERKDVESQAGQLLGAVFSGAKASSAPPVIIRGHGVVGGVQAIVDIDRAQDDAQRDGMAKLDAKADAFNKDMERDSEGMGMGLSPA